MSRKKKKPKSQRHLRIAVLISGAGRTLANLQRCIDGDVVGSVNVNQGFCDYPMCGYQCGGGACPP